MEITTSLSIPDNEITFTFIRASGPGGQNVNKLATAAQLRFNVCDSPSLTAEVKQRLVKLAGTRMTQDGVLVIEAKRHRSQEQNRLDALDRLSALVQNALIQPKTRKQVILNAGPGRAREKIHRSKIKQLRRDPGLEDG